MELDPIIKDLGASALALRPQESCSCKPSSNPLSYKSMGLFLILILFLILANSGNFLWSIIPMSILAITASSPKFSFKRKREK